MANRDEFYYEIKGDDKSINIIRRKEKFFGYETSNPTIFSKSIKNLALEIYADSDIMSDFEFAHLNRDSKFVKASKRIWKDIGIELQDVQYFKEDIDESLFDGKITSEFCSKLALDSPTKIPIRYIDDFLLARSMGMYLEFQKHNAVLFKEILLPKVEKEVNSCIYAHEITHAEMDNAGGGINKITNMETLPILIELLFSNKIVDNNSVKDKLLRHRLAYLAGAIAEIITDKNMDFERRIKLETYIISIIQGVELYNKFEESNDEGKQDIIDHVNKIFNGKSLVEDVLDQYDCHYSLVKPKLKELKRRYNK